MSIATVELPPASELLSSVAGRDSTAALPAKSLIVPPFRDRAVVET